MAYENIFGPTPPVIETVSRTMNGPAFKESKDYDFKHKIVRKKHLKHTALDHTFYDYECNMRNKHQFISDDSIRKKAQKLTEEADGKLQIRKNIARTFSRG